MSALRRRTVRIPRKLTVRELTTLHEQLLHLAIAAPAFVLALARLVDDAYRWIDPLRKRSQKGGTSKG